MQVTGTGLIPSSAESAILNVTAISSPEAHNGYLTIFPTGTKPPTASSLNFTPSEAVPNLVTATLGQGGTVSILSSSTDVNVVVDIEGYYTPSISPAVGFHPLPTPFRALDTRCSITPAPTFCANEQIPGVNSTIPAPKPRSSISVDLAGIGGSAGVPLTATAISLNLTAAGPASGGYLTIWSQGSSTGTTPPITSNVNFHRGTASSNSVVVMVSSSGPEAGKVYIYNAASTATNVIVDISGYFAPGGYMATPSSPVRICDTRAATVIGGTDVTGGVTGQCSNTGTALDPAVSATDPVTMQVTGIGGIPANAKAIIANVTAVNTTANGYLTVWNGTGSQPATSNVNWTKGDTVPNMIVSAIDSAGQVTIYASVTTNVIVDIVGWYS